jgi:hypothetical protein
MVSPLDDGIAEQATLQSVTVVVPAEHDSEDEDVLDVLEVLEVLELLVVCVEVVDLLCGLLSSSGTGGLEQSLNIGIQGISKLGRLGNSQTTAVMLGRFQITTAPPHPGHQITGTTVDELSLPLLVVSQELAESPVLVINSVEKLAGTVVIVDTVTEVPDTDGADCVLLEAHVLWLVELVDVLDDVLLAMVEVDCGEADIAVVLDFAVVVPPLLLHELVHELDHELDYELDHELDHELVHGLVDAEDVDEFVKLVTELDGSFHDIDVEFP